MTNLYDPSHSREVIWPNRTGSLLGEIKSPSSELGFKKMGEEGDINGAKKIPSPCDVEALKKCLQENKGDYVKCQSQIEAFKSSCSLKKPTPSVGSTSSSRSH
ncbi:hypothetical protein Gotri_008915 [Gossypium trilobum]|uniref:Uncharacterized protein n=1 Tax=Gossypium trilobum TaxID=34281 RepID=A0A7J9EMB6_9ROSI|nr:hypothetical protein [Gossypium trilobum]